MSIDRALSRNDRFGYSRALSSLLDPVFIRLSVDELERIARGNILIQALKLTVVKEDLEALEGRNAKVVIAMCANLQGFKEFAFIQRIVALRTFDEDALGLYLALLVFRLIVDLRSIAFEPSHL